MKNKALGIAVAAMLAATPLFGVFAAMPRSASAASETVELSTQNSSLFLPASYEQFLKLENPTSFDISEDYIAIADGYMLYIYDRTEGKYTEYEHMNPLQPADHANISKVQIAEVEGAKNDRIFFSDGDLHLYEYQAGKTSTEMVFNIVNATSFLVDEAHKALFTANAPASHNEVVLTRYALDGNFQSSQDSFSVQGARSPLLAVDGDMLYLVYDDSNIRACSVYNLSMGSLTILAEDAPITGLHSVERYQGKLYYTVQGQAQNKNGLYYSENSKGVRLPIGDGVNEGLGALGVYKDELYCIRDKSVLKLAVGEDGGVSPTGYEIAAASNSVNRLDNATESVRAGGLVVTADVDNGRISIYDTETGEYQTIGCEGVSHVATNGEAIAAATNEKIFIYEPVWSGATLSFVLQKTAEIQQNNVVGVVCVYGVFYFVTSDFYYGKIEHGDDGWNSTPVQRNVGTTPTALTADLFGDIFVADSNGNIYRLGEEDFAATGGLGDIVTTIDSGFSSLRAGFDGKLYYLDSEKNLCMYDGKDTETVATVDGKNFVYTGEEKKKPVSFALGFEDDEVYFCFGDFVVKTHEGALGLATLESVSKATLDASAKKLSDGEDLRDVKLADFAAGAVGIHINFGALAEDGSYCLGYERFPEARRGVLLASHGDYSLIALYHDHIYSTELFRTADMTREPFAPEYEDAGGRGMFLASGCTPYRFPCIIDAPAKAAEAAPRGTRVSVVGILREGGQEAAQGGYDFAYVEYGDGKSGYVPYAYLTYVDPLGDAAETFSLGFIKPGVTFRGDDGSEVTPTERVAARLYDNGDGTYTAVYTADGVTYSATVEEGNIEWGESDALRIALIVILSVVAVLIIGGYVYLLPREKKQNKKKLR